MSGNSAIGGAGTSYFEYGTSGGDGLGGGLYVAGGWVYVNQSTVAFNGACGGAGGGGWDVWYGADGGSAAGGGICVGGGTLEVRSRVGVPRSEAGGASSMKVTSLTWCRASTVQCPRISRAS